MPNGFEPLEDAALSWLLDTTSDAIAVRRMDDLRLVRANQAYADLVGVPIDRLPGTTPSEVGVVDTDGHGRWLQTLADRGVHIVESDLVLASCVKRIRVTARIFDVGGTACSVSVLRDITGEHLAHRALEREEANLRAAEERYRTLVEQIPAVVYIDAAEGPETTIYISPQTESILGFTQRDWMTDPGLMSKHVHPDDLDRWRASAAQAEATAESVALEYRFIRADGSVVWMHDESVPIRDASGRVVVWQGVMFDITDRKAAEEALLDALERERSAATELRALDDMKNTFLAAVSHELRTPLTAILGAALTLERDDLQLSDSESRDLMGGLASNARKLHRLLGDLLDIDRLGRGIIEPNLRPTNLAALVRGVLAESEILGERAVTVDLEDAFVDVDAPKVERIVENLLANAGRHTPLGTPVWVAVRAQPDGVLLVVEDAGHGVPAEARDSVFEPFHQLAPGTPHSPGVGVGLSLVRRFAELHGGRAWVEDRVGGGASFRVFLPHPPSRDVDLNPL